MLAENRILQGRYRVVRQLGQGGMGAVYEAVDQRLSRTVALKETLVDSEELRNAFEHEARLLANLRHPALPKVIDHFIEDDGQFLVMEFIPGDDLGIQLQKQGFPFPPTTVLQWTDELLDLLDYLHTHDPPVIHRDIKPHNLKLTSRGRIILLDFGLAKGTAGEMTRVSSGRTVVGYTPHYASLEQIQGEKTNAQSDLYSLAAALYKLLTNRTPVDALKRATELINDGKDPLLPVTELNPNVMPELAGVLARALALRPSDRPASASAMRASLHNPSVATDPSEDVTRIRPSRQITVALPGSSAVTSNQTSSIRGFESQGPQPYIDPVPKSRKKVWVITSIVCALVILAGIATVIGLRSHEPVSTVAPTNIPDGGIPAPYNAAVGALAALTIQDADGRTLRQGTGVFFRPDEVVTSLAVIDGASRGRVSVVGQSGSFEIGNVTGFDPIHHLVTFKANGAKAAALTATTEQRTTVGDKIAALSTASGYKEALYYQAAFATGAIASYSDDDQIEVKFNGGTAPGSPVLNERGELVGVLTTVTGGNANQAMAAPILYVAQMSAKKTPAMSLAVAAAKDVFFDFRGFIAPDSKALSAALVSKIASDLKQAHKKPVVPPPTVSNSNTETPVPSPVPIPESDDFAGADATGMIDGAFTAPGLKQTAYLVKVPAAAGHPNSAVNLLVIYNGDHYLLDLPIKDPGLILKSFDLNRDGLNELLIANVAQNGGESVVSAVLVDVNKGKLRVIRDFGYVNLNECAAPNTGAGLSASAIFASSASSGQLPDFRVDNYDAPCNTQTADSAAWKYSSTGKLPAKH